MKNLFLFSIITLLLISCHKREKDKKECNGVFIGITNWSHRSSTLATYSTSTGEFISQYGPTFEFWGLFLAKTYNSTTKDYYLLENDDGLLLHKCNLASESRERYEYNGAAGGGKDILLVSNTSGKLYLLVISNLQHRFVELQLIKDAIPYCMEREFYTIGTLKAVTSPFINESTGFIYFMYGLELRKVDPATGISATVITYSDVQPAELYYNTLDKMVYGIDKKSTPYNFIKLNPENGVVTKLSQLQLIDTNYSIYHTYDPCKNLYILSNLKTHFISPQNGQTVKEMNNMSFDDKPYFEK